MERLIEMDDSKIDQSTIDYKARPYIVVRDDTSEAGLRRLHLLRAGKKVEREEVMVEWGIDPGQVRAVMEYQEEDTGMWHLRMYWAEGLNGKE